MSRGWGCVLLIVVADVLIAAGQASHFTGLTLLLIIGLDAVLALLFALPGLAEANRNVGRASAVIDEEHRIRHAASVLKRGQS